MTAEAVAAETTVVGRLYRPCWVVASVCTGLVAGFMLGHALILGPFLDWLLTSGRTEQVVAYAAFTSTAGRLGLGAYYVVCGLQVLSVLAFLSLALATRRERWAAAVAAAAGTLWMVVHYASGFGAVEATVLHGGGELAPSVAARFVRLNAPIHFLHAALLITALAALLALGRSAPRGDG